MLERLLGELKPDFARLVERALAGRELSREDAITLLGAQGADYQAMLLTADAARRADKGDDVSYVVCRNINFTNICYVGCSFCGFARHRDEPDAYDRSIEQILAKCDDAVARGATEVCIQGGIDPQKEPLQADPHLDQGESTRTCTSTRTRPKRSATCRRRAAGRSRSCSRG
jgi:2-iminoacetate synthase ThiH